MAIEDLEKRLNDLQIQLLKLAIVHTGITHMTSECNAIEDKFGEAKRRYGLNRVLARLSGTSASVIHLITIVMNLQKILRDLFVFFFFIRFFTKRRQIYSAFT